MGLPQLKPEETASHDLEIFGQAGFHLCLVSSIAVARTREAQYNSWDKNDPKDAPVILHLLKNGTTQRYLDPIVTGHHDLQDPPRMSLHILFDTH